MRNPSSGDLVQMPCVVCIGAGATTCSSCGGAGATFLSKSRLRYARSLEFYQERQPCRICFGTGRTSCLSCKGVGWTLQHRNAGSNPTRPPRRAAPEPPAARQPSEPFAFTPFEFARHPADGSSGRAGRTTPATALTTATMADASSCLGVPATPGSISNAPPVTSFRSRFTSARMLDWRGGGCELSAGQRGPHDRRIPEELESRGHRHGYRSTFIGLDWEVGPEGSPVSLLGIAVVVGGMLLNFRGRRVSARDLASSAANPLLDSRPDVLYLRAFKSDASGMKRALRGGLTTAEEDSRGRVAALWRSHRRRSAG